MHFKCIFAANLSNFHVESLWRKCPFSVTFGGVQPCGMWGPVFLLVFIKQKNVTESGANRLQETYNVHAHTHSHTHSSVIQGDISSHLRSPRLRLKIK